MEDIITMNDTCVRFLTNEVLSRIWHSTESAEDLPSKPALSYPKTEEMIENLCKVIRVQMVKTWSEWKYFLRKNSSRMTLSFSHFATYSIFGFYIVIDTVDNVYETFINILALVAEFAVYVGRKGHQEYKQIVPDIMAKFCQKELPELFNDQSCWKKFHLHLLHQEHLKLHKVLQDGAAEGKSKADILKDLSFDTNYQVIWNKMLVKDIKQSEIEKHEPTRYLLNCVLEISSLNITTSTTISRKQHNNETAQNSILHPMGLISQVAANEKLEKVTNSNVYTGLKSESEHDKTPLEGIFLKFKSGNCIYLDRRLKISGNEIDIIKLIVVKKAKKLLKEIRDEICALENLVEQTFESYKDKYNFKDEMFKYI